MSVPSYQRDVELIYELGAFRRINRMWHRFLGPDFQNNTEHTFRVAWIALILAKHEGVTNYEKLLKMALVHDIPESRTGDVDYLSRQYVKRDQDKGIQDMLDGTALANEFIELWREYERREGIEAKIVKDADNLDIDFELAEQAASGYDSIFKSKKDMRQHVANTKLFTETAKRMFTELRQVSPHAWHENSPGNRFHSGDWSDVKAKADEADGAAAKGTKHA